MANINSTAFINPRTTYCTVDEIQAFLQIAGRTDTTAPSTQDIETLILRAEREIDRKTRHSWKLNEVRNEMYDFGDSIGYQFRANPTRFRFYDDRGKMALRHRAIRKILSLLVWDGSQYIDYVTNYAEGRGKDYWIDYQEGVIYFWSRWPWRFRNAMKIDYQWGEYEVPEDIREACIKLVARQLVASDDYSVLFPEGTSNIPLRDKSELWKDDIKDILAHRTEIVYF